MSFLPKRWANGSLTGARLHPIRYSLNLSEQPLSTADMTLPQEDSVELFQYYELSTPNESAGIFRVASITTDYETGLPHVYLERGETVLGDNMIDKADESASGTITQVVTTVLGYQRKVGQQQEPMPKWVVGTIEATASIYMDIGEQTILDCLTSMLNYIPEYHLEFDQTQYPWRVHVKANPTTPTSEGRLSRNIVSCSVGYDTSDMCTRVLNDKLPNGKAESSRINDYDRVFEQTIVLDENASPAQKQAVAQSYMANRDKPAVTVNIEARDLYAVTGVSIDHFQLSQMFRLALPDYNITENLRIIAISYNDVYGRPESVSLTLANRTADLVIDIARSRRGVGGGGGGGGGGGYGKAVEKVKMYVFQVEDETKENSATLTVQQDRITALVTKDTTYVDPDDPTFTTQLYEYTSSIIQTAETVSSHVTAISYLDDHVESAESAIEQNATNIALKVSIGDVATQLAVEAGNVTVSGGNLVVDGYATVGALTQTNNNLANYMSGDLTAQKLVTNRVDTGVLNVASDGSMTCLGHSVSWKDKYVCTARGSITMPSLTLSDQRAYCYMQNGIQLTSSSRTVLSYTAGSVNSASYDTIYYLGR